MRGQFLFRELLFESRSDSIVFRRPRIFPYRFAEHQQFVAILKLIELAELQWKVILLKPVFHVRRRLHFRDGGDVHCEKLVQSRQEFVAAPRQIIRIERNRILSSNATDQPAWMFSRWSQSRAE